ncbi:MAG: DegV family protein [Lachnospiraceae bacterium]|nr:DegV family protein [Lachnospiraceae bacterium]
MKTAIITDSNSGITREKANRYGIKMLPMPFYIDDELYLEGETLSHVDFFAMQQEGARIYTSQPSPADVMELWDQTLEEYDEILYIPMSSGLSGSCQTAQALAQDYDGKVIVADLGRVSVAQKHAVLEAVKRARAGMNASDICKELVYFRSEFQIYLTVETLDYLKAGGRVSASSAAIGNFLNIRPILGLNTGQVEVVSKAKGEKLSRKKMISAIENDLIGKFHANNLDDFYLAAAASMPKEKAAEWKQQLEEHFGIHCNMSPIPLSVATHLGYGTHGVAVMRKMK